MIFIFCGFSVHFAVFISEADCVPLVLGRDTPPQLQFTLFGVNKCCFCCKMIPFSRNKGWGRVPCRVPRQSFLGAQCTYLPQPHLLGGKKPKSPRKTSLFVHSDENLTPLMKIIIELYGLELKMKHNTKSVFVIAIVLQKVFGGLFAIRAVSPLSFGLSPSLPHQNFPVTSKTMAKSLFIL